jgi:hypothetical protein
MPVLFFKSTPITHCPQNKQVKKAAPGSVFWPGAALTDL